MIGFRKEDEQEDMDNLNTEELKMKIQELVSANKEKTKYMLRLSHDMRTPMNCIIGLTQITLQRDDLSDEVRKNLIDIQSSSEILMNLIKDTLDMNKISDNKMVLHEKPENYSHVVRRLVTCIRPAIKEKKIDFRIKYVNTRPCVVVMDSLRVEQLFMNLLSNAVKFTPSEGKVEFIVEKLSQDEDISHVKISVNDTGIGISEEFMPRLFEPFAREDEAFPQMYEGTGLGMPIVKRLVGLMGGKIEVDSVKYKGTSISVYLDFKRVNELVKNKEIDEMQIDDNVFKGKRILVCEDHALNSKVVTYMLNNKDMVTECATNGSMAVEMFEKSAPGYYDLVLMDVIMPFMDGVQATKMIRALKDKRPDAGKIPIIAMTANVYEHDTDKCLLSGMNDYITKPIDMKEMYSILYKNLSE